MELEQLQEVVKCFVTALQIRYPETTFVLIGSLENGDHFLGTYLNPLATVSLLKEALENAEESLQRIAEGN